MDAHIKVTNCPQVNAGNSAGNLLSISFCSLAGKLNSPQIKVTKLHKHQAMRMNLATCHEMYALSVTLTGLEQSISTHGGKWCSPQHKVTKLHVHQTMRIILATCHEMQALNATMTGFLSLCRDESMFPGPGSSPSSVQFKLL